MATKMPTARGKRKQTDGAYRALRKEKSRVCAERRRKSQKTVMDDLTSLLPFPADVTSTLDNSSLLRLVLCYFKLKSLIGQEPAELDPGENGHTSNSPSSMELVLKEEPSDSPLPAVRRYGVTQELFMEALDGMVMVLLLDGTIMYISESMLKHLGLFQSEHIGTSINNLLHADDQSKFTENISKAEREAEKSCNGTAKVTFFSRIRCSRFKVTNTNSLSPGYKLVYISGTLKLQGSEPYVVCLVQPVNPPSILEIRSEGNVFTMHYTMEMKCTFYDGRLWQLLGYKKNEFIGATPFDKHHHDDVQSTLECGKEVMEKGEALSSYYRMLTKFGHYVWIQTRATVMKCGRSGNPSYIICMNYVISKEDGDRYLTNRMGSNNTTKSVAPISHDPFPVTDCKDDKIMNPLRVKEETTKPFSAQAASNNGHTASHFPSYATSANTLLLDTSSSGLHTTAPSLDTTVPSLYTTSHSLDTTAPSLDTIIPSLDTSLDTLVPSLDTSPPSSDTPADMSFLESLLQPNSVSSDGSYGLSASPASSFIASPSSLSTASPGVPSFNSLSLTHDVIFSSTDDLMLQSHDLLPSNEVPLSYTNTNEAPLSNMRPNSSSSDEGLLDSFSNGASPITFSAPGSASCNSVLSELDQGYQSDFVPSVSSAPPQSYSNANSPYFPPLQISSPPAGGASAFSSNSLLYTSSNTCNTSQAAMYAKLSAPLPSWNSELGHVTPFGNRGMSSSANQRCPPIDSLAFYSTAS